MKSINSNQTPLKTLFFGLLCLLAGVVCFAKGYSHRSIEQSMMASATPGEWQGVSPPSAFTRDAGNPQFTSLTARYVTKRIADLEVGEEVVAKDPESGEVTTKRVANVFRKVSGHLRILQVRNPLTNEVQTIETTDDHPFWVAALGQWIDAKDLKVGDRLDDVDGGTAILEATSRELHPEGIPVFNFEVEDFHTYFVRAHGSRGPPVLTHNTDCGPDGFVSIGSFENAARNGTTATSTAFHDPDRVEQAAANAASDRLNDGGSRISRTNALIPSNGAYEYYYRAMSYDDFKAFQNTGRVPGTTETFVSPTRSFSESYNGVLIRFQLAAGATDALRNIGVRAHGSRSAQLLPDLPTVRSGWGKRRALFKPEGSQINIGLGTGDALDIFNDAIRGFEIQGYRH